MGVILKGKINNMTFNEFLFRVFDLLNKSNSNINITLTPQKGGIIDILVSIQEDVIIDTSMDIHSFPEENKGKMTKIIDVINKYC